MDVQKAAERYAKRLSDPQPVTITDELLAQVRDELRILNERLEDAEPSGPAVADGLTVTEQHVDYESPQPCEAVTAKGTPCGRMPPCRYHDSTESKEG